MQPVPTAPTAAEDGGLSTHVLHMTRLHAKRPLLVELRVINGPFEGGCRLQSGAGAWLACNTSTPLSLRMQALTAVRFDDILAHVTFTGPGSKDRRLYIPCALWDQTRVLWRIRDPGD